MLLDNKFGISDRLIWLLFIVCIIPLILNLAGLDLGFVDTTMDPYLITHITNVENDSLFSEILQGRYVHLLFVSASVTIAFLTLILAFVDFKIKHEVSTPIVGIALFCSGLFQTFHILIATQLINIEGQQYFIASYTWFFSRFFHAGILILGCGIFLLFKKFKVEKIALVRSGHLAYLAAPFVVLTLLIILMLVFGQRTAAIAYPFRNIAKKFDLIPLGMYIFLAAYLLPKFYLKYPSVFSRTLLLSMIPAIACQLYMAFGSQSLYDNSFNISHFMMALTYFIPFVGLGMNYLETHSNERNVIELLVKESAERKATENVLKGVLDSSHNSILALEPVFRNSGEVDDFIVKSMNPATFSIFNLPENDYSGQLLFSVLTGVKEENWLTYFQDVLRNGDAKTIEYFSQYYKKWLLMVTTPIKNGLAVTISDISKRKLALEQLMKTEKVAVTGRIARTIAHEIRNPLTNINLSLDQLRYNQKVSAADQENKLFEIIERNSTRINQLITELLDSSRPASLDMKEYKLGNLISESISLSEDRAKLKGIEINYNIESPDVLLNVDKEKINSAILNILINAIEAVEEQKGQINVVAGFEGKFAFIKITDNGSGISPEILSHLFEPFNTGKQKGVGLGLTSVQNIVTAHQGDIEVLNEPGTGATFIIRLPGSR